VDLTPLVWLLIGPWLASIAVRPAFAVFRGLDKVKVPGLVTCAGGIVNVCLSIVLIRFTGLGIYGVAWALLVCLAGKNLLFTPVYTSLIMGVSKMVFIRSLLPGTVMALLLTLAGLVLSRVYHLATIPRLLGVTVMLLPIYAITCYSVFMTCEERRLVWSVLLRKELSRV
jgi:O-antigen/teichoic acid export membrane protein